MRDEESNWFSRWEDQLPPPDELMPLSQTLITPDLALAFNILPNPINHRFNPSHTPPPPPPHLMNPLTPNNNNYSLSVSAQPNNSSEFDNSAELLDSGAGASDEQARTLKRPRLVWTPQLHKRFVDAVGHLGIKNAVPKTIMQLMSVDGLTRENVASHLQKYRLYLKRMQGLSGGGGNVGLSSGDSAMDRLFASASVPPQFLHPNRPNSDHFSPFAQHHPQLQQQFHQHRQVVGPFGSPPNGQFEHSFSRQAQQQQQQPVYSSISAGYVHNLDSSNAAGGRKVLTLFPDGDN